MSDNPFSDQGGNNPYAAPGKPNIDTGGPIRPGSVKSYLTEAILCLVCCGGVFAIPAIVYAAQVDSKLRAGDRRGAIESSENAKKWCIIAVCIGITCGGLSVLIQILAISADGGF
jgi:hypothetical protein